MQYLFSGPNDDLNHNPSRENTLPDIIRQPYISVNPQAKEPSSFRVGPLLRKYWLLLLLLAIFGGAAGFVSVVLSSPMYQSHLIVELQNPNAGLSRDGAGASLEASDVEIQTQVNILQSGTFRKKGADRMNSEMVPLAPTGRDIFSRLRQRIHPATQNPMEARSTGLMVAMGSFQARPVNRTRLIELSCQSTSPDVAAGFLNAMAEEFKDDSSQSRMLTAQRTSEWLANQVEDTKAKVHDSEERLQEFILASGNVFAGQDATLDDTKLAQLKAELAKIQNHTREIFDRLFAS